MSSPRDWRKFNKEWQQEDPLTTLVRRLRYRIHGFRYAIRRIRDNPTRAAKSFEPWGMLISAAALLLAVAAFWVDYEDRTEERILRAWQLVTTEMPVNAAKIEALEYLNRRTSLSGIDLSSEGGLYSIDLTGIDLTQADLSLSNLSGANLQFAELSAADLSGADLSGTGFLGANLSLADFSDANLNGTSFWNADLRGANLGEVDLSGVHLAGANLSGACLHFTNLRDADLDGANLSKVSILGADLSGVDLSVTNLDPDDSDFEDKPMKVIHPDRTDLFPWSLERRCSHAEPYSIQRQLDRACGDEFTRQNLPDGFTIPLCSEVSWHDETHG